MSRPGSRWWVLAVGVWLAVLSAGCQTPAAQERIARRENNIRQTLRILDQHEAVREQRLAGTLAQLEKRHQRDVQRTTETNPHEVNRRIQADIDRWNESQPLYRQKIEDELSGDPQNIERTLPKILY